MNHTLYFFGDSICFGQYVSTHLVWTTRISQLVYEALSPAIVTQVTAVNGETTTEALERIEHCVLSHEPSVVWIQFGLNDANYWRSDRGLPRVSAGLYVQNILEMIERVRVTGTERVLVATNHEVSKVPSHLNDSSYRDNALLYNERLREGISRLGDSKCTLVDIEAGFASRFDHPSDYLLDDGVHLNHAGHETYLDLAFPFVESALRETMGA